MKSFENNHNQKTFHLSYGWHHYWDEPIKNKVFIKEYVKGPNLKTVLIFSDPYLTDVKQDPKRESLEIRTGIPDPWSEYVIFNYLLPSDNSLRQCKMFKEDLNIVDTLRKRYRLYLGQGIPDPCLIHPYINRPDLIDDDWIINKTRSFYCSRRPALKKSRKKHCFCCEKAYLFQCPDESHKKIEKIKCSCTNCHGQLVEDKYEPEFREICTRVHYYDEPSEEMKSCCEDCEREEKSQELKKPTPVTIKPIIEKIPERCASKQKIPSDLSKIKEKSNVNLKVLSNETSKPLRPQSSEKKFRFCCCPYMKVPNRHKAKEPSPIPTKVEIPKMSPPIMKTAKATQMGPAKCSKEIQTVQTSLKSLIRYQRICECSSKCTLCDKSQCKGSDSICPNNRLLINYKCPSTCCKNVHSSPVSFETKQIQTENDKVQQTDKDKARLKKNQKMYCCTFTPECVGCSVQTTTQRGEQSQKNRGESPKTTSKRSFVYHCTTPSMASMMTNYLKNSKDFNLRKTCQFPEVKPSFYYELKPGRRKLTEFDLSLEKIREGKSSDYFKRFHDKRNFDSTVQTNVSQRYSTERVPLEVKYLNVKSDESKTYGLLNTKSRRRGRRIRSIASKKISSRKFQSSKNRIEKCNKLVEVESKDVLEQPKKNISKAKRVSFKSSNTNRLLLNHKTDKRDEHLRFICRYQAFKPTVDYSNYSRERIEKDLANQRLRKYKDV